MIARDVDVLSLATFTYNNHFQRALRDIFGYISSIFVTFNVATNHEIFDHDPVPMIRPIALKSL
jgi:hypothetical protein